MGDAENFVSEALQEGHSMPDIIAAMGQHSNPQFQQFAQNWNNVANQPAYQPGMGPGASAQDTETLPTNNMTGALDWAQQNPGQAFAYGLVGASALGAAGVAGKRAAGTTFDALDALRSRYLPNQQELNDTSKTNAYANQVQAQNAQLQAGSEAPEIDAHEEYLKQHERRQAEIKTQMEEAKLEAIKSKGVKPEGKPKPVSPQDQAILDAIARGNVKPVTGPTPAPPPPTEFAAATQQTNPMSNAGNAPANEVPKNEAPIQGAVQPQAPTEATETGTSPATMDNNKSSEKTTLPEQQVSKGGTPATELTTGSGMPAYQGTAKPGLRKKEMAGLHELGSDMAFVPNGQNMDILRNAIGQENYTKLLKESGGFPSTPELAYSKAREINASLGRSPYSAAKEAGEDLGQTTKSITKRVSPGGKMVTMGGVAGALISLADLANASPSQRANVAGENAVGMLPPALQAALYSKEATSPEELEFERKNNAASKEAIKKRQEAAPRLYKSIGPAGSVSPY